MTKIEIHDENSKFDYSPIHTCDVWRFLLNASVNHHIEGFRDTAAFTDKFYLQFI